MTEFGTVAETEAEYKGYLAECLTNVLNGVIRDWAKNMNVEIDVFDMGGPEAARTNAVHWGFRISTDSEGRKTTYMRHEFLHKGV